MPATCARRLSSACLFSGLLLVASGCGFIEGEGDTTIMTNTTGSNLPAPTAVVPASATNAQATNITVYGLRFTGATGAKVGGTALTSLAVVSDTQLTATVPSGVAAGSYILSVTTPAGTSVVGIGFTVTAPATALPVLTSVAPAGGPPNATTAVTIDGSGFTGATGATLGSTALTGLTVVSDARITATVPSGVAVGNYILAVTTPAGTSTNGVSFTIVMPTSFLPVVTSVAPASGYNHKTTALTIDGTSLSGATGAALAGHALTGFTAVSATRVTATVPVGLTPGNYAVTVTTAAGTSTAALSYTVLDGTPTVTGVSPATFVPGTATAVTITGTNLDALAASLAAALVPVGGGGNTTLTKGTLAANATGTQLTGFSIPAMATRGSYNLQLTTTAGTLSLPSALASANLVAGNEGAHLLITEVVIAGNLEFIEIYNPTGAAVPLAGYYLTDALDDDDNAGNGKTYWKITDPSTRANASSGVTTDFHLGFPAGVSLASGAYAVIVLTDQAPFTGNFYKTYGVNPDYEIATDGDSIPNMVAAPGQTYNPGPTMDTSVECVVLYYWDGASILVQDVDYFIFGTGAALDAVHVRKNNPPQAGAGATPLDPAFGGATVYRTDTHSDAQEPWIITKGGGALPGTHGSGHDQSFQRRDMTEYGERTTGGNGIGGHDETSEHWLSSFHIDPRPASPGRPSVFSPRPGQTGVAVTSTVSAWLPRNTVDAATVTNTNFTLTDLTTGTAVTTAVAWSAGTETATLTPTASLTVGHRYRATIATAVTWSDAGAGGPYFSANQTWDFYTGTVATSVNPGDIVINEAFGAPAGTDDPNGDGATHASDDEFVELLNTTTTAIDLEGYTLWDAVTTKAKHRFAPGTILPPGGVVVVFGGGNVTNFPTAGANGVGVNVLGVLASGGSGLSLNATNETVSLLDAGGAVIDRLQAAAFTNSKSLNRAADGLAGARLLDHDKVVGHENTGGAGQEYSPGKRVDQGSFRAVYLNEVFSQPDGTDDDPNGDGTFSATQDEFIELVNASGTVVDLAGYTLSEGATVIHTFATGTPVPALGSIVVFGGGTITGFPAAGTTGAALLATAWPGTGLADGGGTITLEDAGGSTIDGFAYGAATAGTSFNRNADGLGASGAVLHGAVTGSLTVTPWSPGKRVDGNALPYVIINEVFAEPDGANDDPNGDGTKSAAEDEFVELLNRTPVTVDVGSHTIRDAAGTVLYTIPVGTQIPGYGGLVIFGGGTPTGFPPAGQSGAALALTTGSLALADATTPGLTATAVSVNLHNAAGTRLSTFAWDDGTNLTAPVARKSLNRYRDGANTGTAGVAAKLHDNAEGQVAPAGGGQYSPGRRTDQTFFP